MKLVLMFLVLAIGSGTWPAYAGGIDTLYYAHAEPYFIDEDGHVGGPAIDIVYKIMATAGNPITPDTFKDIVWARAVQDVEIDEGKGLVGFIRTPQREGRFKWVGPIGKVSLGFWAKKRRPIKFNISQELLIYKVGVVMDSAPEHILVNRFNFTTDKLERLRSEGSLVRMLAVGRLDLVVLNDAFARKIILSQGLNPDEYEKVCTLTEADFYLALNKDTGDELVTRLQEALDNLKTQKTGQTTSTFQKIYDSYN